MEHPPAGRLALQAATETQIAAWSGAAERRTPTRTQTSPGTPAGRVRRPGPSGLSGVLMGIAGPCTGHDGLPRQIPRVFPPGPGPPQGQGVPASAVRQVEYCTLVTDYFCASDRRQPGHVLPQPVLQGDGRRVAKGCGRKADVGGAVTHLSGPRRLVVDLPLAAGHPGDGRREGVDRGGPSGADVERSPCALLE